MRSIHPALPGGGAAGGLGYALAAIGGVLTEGSQHFAKLTRLNDSIHRADAVVIGEGRLDAPSMAGKVAGCVMDAAAAQGKPVFAFVGTAEDDCGLAPERIIEINGSEDDKFDAAATRLLSSIESCIQ